jgi:hypothetical protein
MPAKCVPAMRCAIVLGLIGAFAPAFSVAQSVTWPPFDPEHGLPRLDGLTDTLPDIIGPPDGSAELTIFTEGHHYAGTAAER